MLALLQSGANVGPNDANTDVFVYPPRGTTDHWLRRLCWMIWRFQVSPKRRSSLGSGCTLLVTE